MRVIAGSIWRNSCQCWGVSLRLGRGGLAIMERSFREFGPSHGTALLREQSRPDAQGGQKESRPRWARQSTPREREARLRLVVLPAAWRG
jgi:hypothetical protein